MQPVPVTVQVTPLAAESPVTFAVKACVPPTATLAVGSDSATATTGAVVNVMVVLADFVPSATEVAVNVTVAGLGTAAGAVYVTAAPEAVDPGATVPQVVPLQPAPDNAQVTPLLPESFATVAVKVCVVPTCTLTVATDIATEINAGAGVLPPPPLPLELTDPAQPEIRAIASSVTTTIERGARPVLIRFTVESPKFTALLFFRALALGWVEQLFVQLHGTNIPKCHGPLRRGSPVTVPHERQKSTEIRP